MDQQQVDRITDDWRAKAANWRAIAAQAADEWIEERSLARAQVWEQAADELDAEQAATRVTTGAILR